MRTNDPAIIPNATPVAGQRSHGRASSTRPRAIALTAPAAPTSANRPISSSENPKPGPASKNVTVVQKQENAPNPQAASSDRHRSTGSDLTAASTPASCRE
jgi:hypothetical protein